MKLVLKIILACIILTKFNIVWSQCTERPYMYFDGSYELKREQKFKAIKQKFFAEKPDFISNINPTSFIDMINSMKNSITDWSGFRAYFAIYSLTNSSADNYVASGKYNNLTVVFVPTQRVAYTDPRGVQQFKNQDIITNCFAINSNKIQNVKLTFDPLAAAAASLWIKSFATNYYPNLNNHTDLPNYKETNSLFFSSTNLNNLYNFLIQVTKPQPHATCTQYKTDEIRIAFTAYNNSNAAVNYDMKFSNKLSLSFKLYYKNNPVNIATLPPPNMASDLDSGDPCPPDLNCLGCDFCTL